jgi:hypothetical protein
MALSAFGLREAFVESQLFRNEPQQVIVVNLQGGEVKLLIFAVEVFLFLQLAKVAFVMKIGAHHVERVIFLAQFFFSRRSL